MMVSVEEKTREEVRSGGEKRDLLSLSVIARLEEREAKIVSGDCLEIRDARTLIREGLSVRSKLKPKAKVLKAAAG